MVIGPRKLRTEASSKLTKAVSKNLDPAQLSVDPVRVPLDSDQPTSYHLSSFNFGFGGFPNLGLGGSFLGFGQSYPTSSQTSLEAFSLAGVNPFVRPVMPTVLAQLPSYGSLSGFSQVPQGMVQNLPLDGYFCFGPDSLLSSADIEQIRTQPAGTLPLSVEANPVAQPGFVPTPAAANPVAQPGFAFFENSVAQPGFVPLPVEQKLAVQPNSTLTTGDNLPCADFLCENFTTDSSLGADYFCELTEEAQNLGLFGEAETIDSVWPLSLNL